MDWQNISTAPKDGTPILCYEPNTGYIRVLRWDGNWSDGDTWDDLEPTHWMPLPEKPKDVK
jgi:hypothetical protein